MVASIHHPPPFGCLYQVLSAQAFLFECLIFDIWSKGWPLTRVRYLSVCLKSEAFEGP